MSPQSMLLCYLNYSCGFLWDPQPWKHFVNLLDSLSFNVRYSLRGLSGCFTRKCWMYTCQSNAYLHVMYLNITPIFKTSTRLYASPLNLYRYILSFTLVFSVYFRLNVRFSEDFNWKIYIINSVSEELWKNLDFFFFFFLSD